VAYICSLTKVDWLAACIAIRVVGAVIVVVPWHWRKLAQSASQWKQGPIPEEIYQMLLTNK
jgi:hypothetical protein